MVVKHAYENLCRAIILQAVDDYRMALRGKDVDGVSPEDVLSECEKFFKSSWYEAMTRLDGSYLILELRKEFENESHIDTTD